ncbi:alpha/beta fold hydrolase [Nocardioides marmoriginsengisoli]|uniref:Alpha/beta fold hydrolase n=1 Tax=Nocardioides marmoriginsengisoli TaxID=661483 RepID=A0A3N0CJA5_9ACTN|nr:alpha/beta fold hydrolase [Nocardioides marmoriginsengisoli]RNL63419.1 alpha/beta fold hydrolase [Nocardioides marmoriginsengisoli]
MNALHTTSYGEQGSRVVFLHGLFGQGRNWTQHAKALAVEHRVLLVDLPDHGRSTWTQGPPGGRGFDILEVADTIAGELAGDDPVALVGHSLGGKVAMALTLRHPGLVERLCVVDIAPVAYQRASEFAGYIEAMRGLDLAALAQRADAEDALAAAVPNRTVRSFLLQNLRRETDPGGASGWRWQANLLGLGRDLGAISSWPEDGLAGTAPYGGPVLWLAGANSEYVTDEYAPAMDRWFPRNRRVTIKNAGHWVHSEQPEVFLEVLRRFLA